MKKLNPLITFCSVISGLILDGVLTSALAGVWTGGGELLRDSQNPWFLEDTTTVSYCLDIDAINFDSDEEELEKLIDLAIQYWKDQFKFVSSYGNTINGKRYIRIADQQFIRTACNANTDLRFQFGRFSQDQETELQRIKIDPTEFVAFSYRMNEHGLKGRGFIYVAPHKGPLTPKLPNLLPNLWANQRSSRLLAVLIHELGHVFGIPHLGGSMSVMGAGFPQFIVSKDSLNQNLPFLSWPGVLHFKWNTIQSVCHERASAIKKFLLLSDDTRCVSIQFVDHTTASIKQITADHRYIDFTSISLEQDFSLRFEELNKIWLPLDQIKFPWVKENFALAPPRVSFKKIGSVKVGANAQTKRMIFALGPNYFQATGIDSDLGIINLIDSANP